MRIPGDRATNVGGRFRFALLVPRCEAGRSAALASESRTFGSPRARKLLSMMQRLAFGGIPSAALSIEEAKASAERSQSTVQRLSADGGALLAQAANRIAGALYGDDEKRLTPEVLIAAAAKVTRLDAKPLADPRLIEALGALTSSLQKEASLSPSGRLAASWDLKRMLSTLLILADAEREDATIFTRPLAAPIFIAGLPRSGTTFLHGLLAEDPANRAPRIWEAIYPYTKHRAAEFGAGRRMVQLQLGIFNRLSPGIRNLHPIEAHAPEECIEFTSQVFRSPRFDDVYRAPSYRAWLGRVWL
jgi:hypothetical protein